MFSKDASVGARQMNVSTVENEAGDDAQRVINSIEPRSVAGLRDRAMVALLAYAGASIKEVVEMRIRDYLDGGQRAWVQLGFLNAARLIEISPRTRKYIDEYLMAANIKDDDSFSL